MHSLHLDYKMYNLFLNKFVTTKWTQTFLKNAYSVPKNLLLISCFLVLVFDCDKMNWSWWWQSHISLPFAGEPWDPVTSVVACIPLSPLLAPPSILQLLLDALPLPTAHVNLQLLQKYSVVKVFSPVFSLILNCAGYKHLAVFLSFWSCLGLNHGAAGTRVLGCAHSVLQTSKSLSVFRQLVLYDRDSLFRAVKGHFGVIVLIFFSNFLHLFKYCWVWLTCIAVSCAGSIWRGDLIPHVQHVFIFVFLSQTRISWIIFNLFKFLFGLSQVSASKIVFCHSFFTLVQRSSDTMLQAYPWRHWKSGSIEVPFNNVL